MRQPRPDRRTVLARGAALLGMTLLAGCDRLSNARWFKRVLDKDEDANLYVQRLLLSQARLAPEYAEGDISPWFKPNGTSDPTDKDYKALAAKNFAGFRLVVDGLVDSPGSFSVADLKAFPSRTQITRHDCVEGWTCIGKWTGVPLAAVLQKVGLKPQARYVVFHCADAMEGGLDSTPDADTSDAGQSDQADAEASSGNQGGTNGSMVKSGVDATPARPDASGSKGQPANDNSDDKDEAASDAATKGTDSKKAVGAPATDSGDNGPVRYYESVDLEDAFHPQTILAYEMNGSALPVAHGAPLRLRVERQLGYKQAKYIMRIEIVDKLDGIGQGGGGYWEDQGYEWYAGI